MLCEKGEGRVLLPLLLNSFCIKYIEDGRTPGIRNQSLITWGVGPYKKGRGGGGSDVLPLYEGGRAVSAMLKVVGGGTASVEVVLTIGLEVLAILKGGATVSIL